MKQKTIALDTAVFARTALFSSIYDQYGYKTFANFLKVKQDELSNTKEAIMFAFDEDFLEEFKAKLKYSKNDLYALNDYKLIRFSNQYIDAVEALKSYVEDLVNNNIKLTKKLSNHNLSRLYKEQLIKRINRNNEAIKTANKKYETLLIKAKNLKQFTNLFKSQKQTCECGKLFQKVLGGEVKLCLTPTIIKEIQHNTTTNINFMDSSQSKKAKINFKDALSLTKYCTLYTFASSNVTNRIAILSNDFRTKNKKFTNCEPMQNHINSLGEFGSADALCEAIFCGANFLTFKKGDLIEYEGMVAENEFIRNHINKVCELHFGEDHNCAKPVTFEDVYTTANPKLPEGIKVSNSTKAQEYFNKVKNVKESK